MISRLLRAYTGFKTNLPAIFNSQSAWMLIGFSAKAILQLISFIYLARILGVGQYGSFIAILSTTSILASLLDFGVYSVIISKFSKGENVRFIIGSAVSNLLIGFSIGILAIILLWRVMFYDYSLVSCILLITSAFLGDRIQMLYSAISLSTSKNKRAAILEIINWTLRLCLVGLLFILDGGEFTWTVLYTAQSLLIGLGSFYLIVREFGSPRFSKKIDITDIKQGLGFSIGNLAKTMYSDLDKVLLSRLASAESVGVFSVASRFVNLIYLPLHALFGSTYKKFFEFGAINFRSTFMFATKLLPVSLLYGIVSGLLIYAFGPLVPKILGNSFAGSASALQLLSITLVAQACQQPFADVFSGTGKQSIRNLVQIFVLILSILLNITLIRVLDWRGACLASIISQFTSLGLFIFISMKYLREDGGNKI
ncbi:oligosaccharide flippase family protein [Deinococcus caeni]|uniref:Polysaccharide biosynthesis protein n=1 Tax=Deinococcus caeni TaxID=569127 RepID=A0ABP9ULV7_9DEIO